LIESKIPVALGCTGPYLYVCIYQLGFTVFELLLLGVLRQSWCNFDFTTHF